MAVASILVLGIALSLCAFIVSRWVNARRPPAGLKRVPGPPGLPVVGHTYSMGKYPQRQLQAWAREYGEVFRIRLGWEDWIFVSSPEACRDIFERQSSITSSRPPAPVSSDLISGGMRFLFMNPSPLWRRVQKIVTGLLTPRVSALFKPYQDFEAKQLVHDMLTDNESEGDFFMHIRRFAASVIMSSTYGKRISSSDSKDLAKINQVMDAFMEHTAPGAYLAELFPPLSRLPEWMQWWRARALAVQEMQNEIWTDLFSSLKSQIDDGTAPECFVKQVIEMKLDELEITELQAAWAAGTLIEAGSETTAAMLTITLMFLANSPRVQARAKAELDEVVGSSRSPTFEDAKHLPYIYAILDEIFRMRPLDAIGSAHYTSADVVYKDYFIPKNTVVSVFQWALHYDPASYDEPEVFKPERFLEWPRAAGKKLAAAAGGRDPPKYLFWGAGRRICPGLHVAQNSMFITLARIIWAFEILPPTGATSVNLSDDAFHQGLDLSPKECKLRFLPRDASTAEIVRRDWTEAQAAARDTRGMPV